MPTDKPKVSAYVPQMLKDKLIKFQKERDISESQAVTVILAEYFGIETEIDRTSHGAEIGGVSLEAFQKLQSQVKELMEWRNKFREQSKPLSKLNSSSTGDCTDIIDRLSMNISEGVKPVSGQCLSIERFGLSKNAVSSNLKRKTTEEFTQWTKEHDPDGIAWKRGEDKKFYPDSELPSELLDKLLEWQQQTTQ